MAMDPDLNDCLYNPVNLILRILPEVECLFHILNVLVIVTHKFTAETYSLLHRITFICLHIIGHTFSSWMNTPYVFRLQNCSCRQKFCTQRVIYKHVRNNIEANVSLCMQARLYDMETDFVIYWHALLEF